MMRILILVFLIYLLYRLVRGLMRVQGPQPSARGGEGDVVDDMVQDPNCGTYIPRSEAVRRSAGGEDLWFCSEACAEAYRKKRNDD
jgi:YHS domain-containing protein